MLGEVGVVDVIVWVIVEIDGFLLHSARPNEQHHVPSTLICKLAEVLLKATKFKYLVPDHIVPFLDQCLTAVKAVRRAIIAPRWISTASAIKYFLCLGIAKEIVCASVSTPATCGRSGVLRTCCVLVLNRIAVGPITSRRV